VARQPGGQTAADTPKPLLMGGASRMSKALMGYVGQPPAYMILRELNALKARVAELERHLADAEQELALREVEDFRPSTTKEAALA
jgi:hypothetical protein